MTYSEKLLKDMNLRLARFGNSDVADEMSISPETITSSDLRRLYRDAATKLVFKIE